MRLHSLSTWIVLLLTAAAALALAGDADDTQFYLSSQRIFQPGDKDIAVNIDGTVPSGTKIRLSIYRILHPVEFFLAQPNPHQPGLLDSGGVAPARGVDLSDRREYRKLTSWTTTVTGEMLRGGSWLRTSVALPVDGKGVYLVAAHTGSVESATVVVVTGEAVVVKQSNAGVLAWVVDRTSGRPVGGADVAFTRGVGSRIDATTGSDGVATIDAPPPLPSGDEASLDWNSGNRTYVFGEHDGNFLICDSWYYGGRGSSSTTWLQTDRPVYRPTQTVYYRGVVRTIGDRGDYRTPVDEPARIEVTDSRGNTVARDTLTLDRFGTFHGEFSIAAEPPLGTWTIRVDVDSATSWHTFSVEEYRKPEYEVDVTTDRTSYTRGDRITATVDASYYFGEPVAGATVEYRVYRQQLYRPWWYGSRYDFYYPTVWPPFRGSAQVANGSGTLSDSGRYTFTFDTKADEDQDFTYRIEATVTDASRREIGGSTSVMVTRGEFYLNAWSDRYVYQPGEAVSVNVSTKTYDGAAVSAPFTARVVRRWWTQDDRHQEKSDTVWTKSGSTASDGSGSIEFTPTRDGYYSIDVTAVDSRGTHISSSSWIYVSDRDTRSWFASGEGGMQIIPDRDIYHPGDHGTALVIAPEPDLEVLIGIEGATLYDHSVRHIDGSASVIEFDVRDEYAPTVFLHASAIRDDRFYDAQQRINVVPTGKFLTLEVRTDRDVYKPGDTGTVTVRALDGKGMPVANTDVALAVVDEALYAIRPDQTPDLREFFYGPRWNSVITSNTLAFRFWWTVSRSGARFLNQDEVGGSAEGAVPNGMAPNALKANGVPSSDFIQPTMRTRFEDLAFWTPSVRTGPDGRASVTVRFPDNLTTWRITARGVTEATAVGEGRAKVVARKNLMVRMETPRFITQGDELLVATTVHNYLSTAKRARVEFDADGATVADHERTVTIPAGGQQRIDWRVTASATGEATLSVRALTDEESDAMRLTVPVLPKGVHTVRTGIAQVRDASGSDQMTLTMPSNAIAGTGAMTVSLSPSAASSMMGALDELIGYPYGCVEQTMSRFLPTVVVAQTLGTLDVPFDAKLRGELPKMVQAGFARLYSMQHSDGGWGWWVNDATNPFMTAYALYGLGIASQAGYAVDSNSFTRGRSALLSLIDGGDVETTTRAYMLYVAATIGAEPESGSLSERIRRLSDASDLNDYARALLALAAVRRGDRVLAGRLVSELERSAKTTTSAAHWEGQAWHYHWQEDQVETTAFALKAILAVDPTSDLIARATHWLLSTRQGPAWTNTRQTAMVVYALADYVRASHELDADYDLSVRVNGTQIYTQHIGRGDVFRPAIDVAVEAKNLKAGANVVTVEKRGQGTLYATATLSCYAAGAALRPAEDGFTVSRDYYLLKRVRRGERYVYTEEKFDGTVRSGQDLLVRVTVSSDEDQRYVMLEDPLPAGCEVVTETDSYEIEGEDQYAGPRYDGRYGPIRWRWWYADRDVRDEKVAFFATVFARGTYEFTYILHAQIPGTYAVMPTVASLMYYPDVRGNAAAAEMRIADE